MQLMNTLESGIRKSREFELKAEIRPGAWFIVGGQKAYVADMDEIFVNAQGRTDARLRVIFDNGTESNMLMRSLQRALHKDEAGRRISDPEAGPLFVREEQSPFAGQLDDDDSASGTIYVLRSKSDHPAVAAHRDVPLHCFVRSRHEPVFRILQLVTEPLVVRLAIEHGPLAALVREQFVLRRGRNGRLSVESRRLVG